MNNYAIVIAVIIVLFLLIFYSKSENSENFYPSSSNPEKAPSPYMKFFQNPYGKYLVFHFEPNPNYPEAIYLRDIYKANIRSMDLFLPLQHDGFDSLRSIKIWNIYNGSNTASTESSFYSPFTEPAWTRRVNFGKYQLLVELKAGEHKKLNFEIPIKKVFIEAKL